MVDPARHAFQSLISTRPATDETAAEETTRSFASEVRLLVRDDEVTQIHAAASDVFALALRRCEQAPGDLEAWDRLESAARAHPQTRQVVALYRTVMDGELPVAERIALGARAVRFHEEWSDDEEERLELLGQVLALDPDTSWAFDRTALLLTGLGRWDDLLALYDRAIADARGDRREALLREAASAARDLAGQPERAVPYLEERLASGELTRRGPGAPVDAEGALERLVVTRSSSPPARHRAFEHLREVYQAAAREDDLIRLLRVALEQAEGPEVVALHGELARRLFAASRDAEGLEHLSAVLALDPTVADGALVPSLLGEAFEGVVAGCRVRLDREGGRSLVQRAARLASSRDLRSEHALRLYAWLRAERPSDPAVVAAIARLHEARGSYSALVRELVVEATGTQALETCVATASDADSDECVLLLAHVHAASGRSETAMAVLEVCLGETPSLARARALQLELLRERCAASHGQPEPFRRLAKSLVEGAQHVEAPRRQTYLREAAALYLGPLAAPAEAVVLLGRAMDDEPADVGIRSQLADALRRVGRLEEAQAMAEGIVRQFGRRRPRERAATHLLLARIARALGRDDELLHQLELAVSIDPGHAHAQRLLGKACLAQGRLARAERALHALLLLQRRGRDAEGDTLFVSETLFDLHRVATLLGDPQRASEALASAFELAARDAREALRLEESLVRAERHTEALPLALRALVASPADERVHARAREASLRARDVESYAACLDSLSQAALDAGDGVTGCALLLRLGEVRDRDLGQLEHALAAYRRAEDTGERLPDVWSAMAGVAGRLGDREARLRALRKLAESPELGGQARADVLYELADHELGARDTVEAGLESLRAALSAAPARNESAVQSLRRALHVAVDREPVARALETVARASGDDRALLDALWAASLLPTPGQAALEEAFRLAVRVGEDERATRLLERAVEVARQSALDPAEGLWAMRLLSRRCESAGLLGDAILWMTRAAELADGAESVALLERAAELAAGPHGDLDLAAQLHERLLDREPGRADVWHSLLSVLRRMASAGDSAPLDFALARAADELHDPAERNQMRMERALGLLASGRTPEACECFRAVLTEDPDHETAARQLADLLQAAGAHEELATLLRRMLEGARARDDVRAGVAVTLRLGNLLAEGRRGEAVDVYRATLSWVPDHPRLLRRLVTVLDPVDDAAELAGRLERLLSRAEGPARFDLALRLLQARRVLGDAEGVESALAIAHGIDPHSPALREPTRWLAQHLEARAAEGPADAVALSLRASRLLRDRLGDVAAARVTLQVALAREPDSLRLLEPLVQCALEMSDRGGALSVVDGAIARCTDADPALGELLSLRAFVYGECKEHEAAVFDLERAVALDGDRWLPALQAAHRGARRAASESGDLDAERAHGLREADLLGRSGETASARALLADLVDGAFYDREACQRMLALDVEAARWDEVAKTCQRMLDLECGPELLELAQLRADACAKLGVPDEARRGLERAHAYDPSHEGVRARLRALYERLGAHRELAEVLEAEAELTPDEGRRFALLREVGRLRLEQAGMPEAAVVPLTQASRLRPEDVEVRRWLVDALVASGRGDEAVPILAAAIACHGGRRSRELAELQHRMARVVAASDPSAQLHWLVEAFQSFPRCEAIAVDLAEAATRHQQYELALRAWRATISIADGKPVLRATAYVRQAQIARAQGDAPRAAFLARKARSEGVELAEAADLLRELGARP